MSRSREAALAALLACALALPAAGAERLGLGRPALPEEIAAWDVAVLPDGQGLRPGSGDVETGEQVFAEKCASCHGDFAEGRDQWPPLAGGMGTLTDRRPVKTIGSYWPYLSTVWDYIHRSMPFGAAQTLSVDEVYALTAFLLYSNGLVEDDFVLTHDNFTEIALPNAGGFYVDDRPQSEYPLFRVEPCMRDCRSEPARVIARAAELGVTPTDPDGRPAGTIPPILPARDAAAPAATETAAAEPATATAPEPAAETPPATAPDPALVAAGERVFRKCKACHQVGPDAANRTGPHLNRLFGRVAGSVEGFRYSRPMMQAGKDGLVWTPETLSEFLSRPRDFIKGTKMAFAGLRDADDIAAIIAYLQAH